MQVKESVGKQARRTLSDNNTLDSRLFKTANIYAKKAPKSWTCELQEIAPFSAKSRTMMHTLSMLKWRDRVFSEGKGVRSQ